MEHKQKSEFKITHRFRHEHNNAEDEVGVLLKIDYEMKQYNIVPLHGKENDFKFMNGKYCRTKWKSICTCITEAVELANKELNT